MLVSDAAESCCKKVSVCRLLSFDCGGLAVLACDSPSRASVSGAGLPAYTPAPIRDSVGSGETSD
jgi:hypothetical protein